jgi:5-methylcytosine-specific restriction endonuclease McrA
MPAFWEETRRRILTRDAGLCRLKYADCLFYATEVDHVVPVSQGGSDADSNLQAACARCHARKTGREAQAAQPRRARAPEPHPGIVPPTAGCCHGHAFSANVELNEGLDAGRDGCCHGHARVHGNPS